MHDGEVARQRIVATLWLVFALLIASACSSRAPAHSAGLAGPQCQGIQQINARRDDQTPVTFGKTIAVVLGDSYAQGLSSDADPRDDTWPSPLGQRLGWTTYVNAIGRTGFVNGGACGGQQYGSRVGAVLALHPAIVVVEGGLNDSTHTSMLQAAADALLPRLRSVSSVVVVGPTAAPGLDQAKLKEVDATLAAATRAAHRRYVSALRWKLPFGPDGIHLTAPGQKQFAAMVADAIAPPPTQPS